MVFTIIFTGPNDGSDHPGHTDLTITSRGNGFFHFDYLYSSLDIPPFDFAGYLLGPTFYQLADTDGQSGTVDVPVLQGEIIGFRIESVDNQFAPGVLTITNFGAPVAGDAAVPEPGSFWYVLIAAACAIAAKQLKFRCRFDAVKAVKLDTAHHCA